ncbi:hypothetical protein RF11_10616 [Thelohanellus kitauei]|uniref:PRELI/MSF1 domain-containing protein n=1 Tax=Thelohanellus kitauei TaxID=669202 RepID=A0A0C2N2X1_THEKT|nr:hypothetical protein RF11_10616 [Thelohanellus kitauei]
MRSRTVSFSSEFQFPWEVCSFGYLMRYSTDLTHHIKSTDILDAYIKDDKLVVICYTVKKNDILKYRWAKYFDRVFSKGEVLEKHVIDLKTKKYISASMNMNARKYLNAKELVEITPITEGTSNVFREFCIQSMWFTDSFASQYLKRIKNHDMLYPSIFKAIWSRILNKS